MNKHRAQHDLPISNGYSSGTGQPVNTWCGRCKDSFAVDRDWADRYFAARRKRIDSDRRLTPGQRLDALADNQFMQDQVERSLSDD